jgi:hypothetical protein
MRASFFCATLIWNILCPDKYLASYTQDAHKLT